MPKFKILLVTAFSLVTNYNFAQHTDEINSNRPGESMSAYAVGKSVIQVETGIYGINENHRLLGYDANGYGLDLDLRYGFLMEKLEVIANIQYQKQDFVSAFDQYSKSNLKQTVLGAKYLLYDPFKNYEKNKCIQLESESFL
ncbi:transporter [Flavobacterium nitratireducens]|uniref:transporter n=1 Tax=Flavobacterium nitratireducens TaxID=992289 RepID=UPI002414F586|nr:transporter [Flavobacterium nitratireducens]